MSAEYMVVRSSMRIASPLVSVCVVYTCLVAIPVLVTIDLFPGRRGVGADVVLSGY
jgi:hypothetical protein